MEGRRWKKYVSSTNAKNKTIAIISLQMKRCINYLCKFRFWALRIQCDCVSSYVGGGRSVRRVFSGAYSSFAASKFPFSFRAIVFFSADVCRIKLKLIKFLFNAVCVLVFFSQASICFSVAIFGANVKIYLDLILWREMK